QPTNAGNAAVFGTMAGERISLPWSPGNTCGRVTPSCPIRPGVAYTYSFTGSVPVRLPSGLMTVRWELLDINQRPFLCVDFDVQLVE
ncbi:Niemann-Pick C2 protein, partial [Clonorchis sinensis]